MRVWTLALKIERLSLRKASGSLVYSQLDWERRSFQQDVVSGSLPELMPRLIVAIYTLLQISQKKSHSTVQKTLGKKKKPFNL